MNALVPFQMVAESIHAVVPGQAVLDDEAVVVAVATAGRRVGAELLEAAASMSPMNREWLEFVMGYEEAEAVGGADDALQLTSHRPLPRQ